MRKVIFSMLAITAAIFFMSNSSCSKKKDKQSKANENSVARKMDSIAAVEEAKAAMERMYADSSAAARRADSIAQIQVDEYYIKEGYSRATVVDNTGLDGCSFMLHLETGHKLQPLNLEKKYQKDGKKVWIKYTIQKDAMSVCMAGDVVNIGAIEER